MQPDTNRTILHMDLDSFFVSVEVIKNPSLKGKPVIVGGSAERGIVASCSYEARKFGIHSAMPSLTAKKLCPQAIFIPGSYQDYSDYSSKVTNIISARVPVMQKSSIDEFYIDLSGMDTFFGAFNLAKEIRELIKNETGLPISFGLSSNKTVSKIATGEAKPDGYLKIEHGKEKEFLSKLHITKIPGVGEKSYPKLKEMGIEMIKDVQDMPDHLLLEEKFGKYGVWLWERANGIDESEVIPYSDRKSISSENTFDKDTTDVEYLQTFVVSVVESLSFNLRKENFLTSCISIKIRYTGFETHNMQMTIPLTASDSVLIPRVKELFNKIYKGEKPVRLIGVRLSNLIHGNEQIDIFDTETNLNLYKALDKINKKYGNKTVHRAKTMNVGDRSFNPFNGMVSE